MAERTSMPHDPDLALGIRRHPRVILTRTRAAIVVVVCYSLTLVIAYWLFERIAFIRNHDTSRNDNMMFFVGAVVGALCLASLVKIVRPPKLPDGR